MNNWQRWLKAPHTLWIRRVVFQVHLWTGIAVGLYILMISVTGSAVIFRPQFAQWFSPGQIASDEGLPLQGAELEMRVAEVYSDFEVIRATPATRASSGLYVVLEKSGEEYTRFFDHYAGEDLGSTYPWQVASMEWLVSLHDDLLMGRDGRKVNGIGGILFLIMVITGLFIWWQGKKRWKEGLAIRRSATRSLNWQIHSFLGFWSLLLMLVWGLTAVYFAFPAPFDFVIDAFDDDLEDFDRPEGWLRFLIRLHFGRFGGTWGRVAWMVVGLLPAVMFITGFIVWWRRVVRKQSRY